MKKIILIILSNLVLTFAQSPFIVNLQTLLDQPGEEAFYPKITMDGRSVIFTHANHNGLFVLDRSSGRVKTLSKALGAGYEYELAPDGQTVMYRSFTVKEGRRFYSLIEYNLKSGEETEIVSGQRNLATTIQSADGSLLYSLNGNWHTAQASRARKTGNFLAVTIRNRHLIVIRDNKETVLDPLGKGIYLWPSLSPSGDKIVFTVGGKGSFVCDLQGERVVELGYLNAPKWSPGGNWIVGMQDFDDGVRITKSEIVLVQADGSKRTVLTHSPEEIELYPAWGLTKHHILFSNRNGALFMAELDYGNEQ